MIIIYFQYSIYLVLSEHLCHFVHSDKNSTIELIFSDIRTKNKAEELLLDFNTEICKSTDEDEVIYYWKWVLFPRVNKLSDNYDYIEDCMKIELLLFIFNIRFNHLCSFYWTFELFISPWWKIWWKNLTPLKAL